MTAPHTLAHDYTTRRVAAIAAQVLASSGRPTSAGAQALAVLRRARPDDPVSAPAAWAYTFRDAPPGLLSDGDDPSPAEAAVHAALVLFARHQQGRSRPMHVHGHGLGRAAKDLAHTVGGETPAESMVTRFNAIGVAGTRPRRMHHLGSFVSLLRAHEIPLDYGQLAADLVLLDDPATARSVRLNWSRDLHRPATPADTPTTTAPESDTNGDPA